MSVYGLELKALVWNYGFKNIHTDTEMNIIINVSYINSPNTPILSVWVQRGYKQQCLIAMATPDLKYDSLNTALYKRKQNSLLKGLIPFSTGTRKKYKIYTWNIRYIGKCSKWQGHVEKAKMPVWWGPH